MTSSVDILANSKMSLEHFVETFALPQRAKVEEGYQDPNIDDLDLSTNDVIDVLRVLCQSVQLTFSSVPSQRADGANDSVNVTVPTTNATRFRVASVAGRSFDSVRQVVEVWPLTVRVDHVTNVPFTTTAFDSITLNKGDVLRLVRIDRQRSGVSCSPFLECKIIKHTSQSTDLVRLALDYTGRFIEHSDPLDIRLFTLDELAQMSKVSRKLSLYRCDQIENNWIPSVPLVDFIGTVEMSRPTYMVELETAGEQGSDDEEDADSISAHYWNACVGADATRGRFLVPISCEIAVSVRSSDYECLVDTRFMLNEYPTKVKNKPTAYVIRILDWLEETVLLENHLIRPLDKLIVYRTEIVRKLVAVNNVQSRRGPHQQPSKSVYLIPINHSGPFSYYTDSSLSHPGSSSTVALSELDSFPVCVVYAGCASSSEIEDRSLPVDQPLVVGQIVEDQSVLVAKLFNGGAVGRAFHLPLRTKLVVDVIGSWIHAASDATVRMTQFSCHAELVTEGVSNSLVVNSKSCTVPNPHSLPVKSQPPAVKPRHKSLDIGKPIVIPLRSTLSLPKSLEKKRIDVADSIGISRPLPSPRRRLTEMQSTTTAVDTSNVKVNGKGDQDLQYVDVDCRAEVEGIEPTNHDDDFRLPRFHQHACATMNRPMGIAIPSMNASMMQDQVTETVRKLQVADNVIPVWSTTDTDSDEQTDAYEIIEAPEQETAQTKPTSP